MEVNRIVAGEILKKIPGIHVDIHTPPIIISYIPKTFFNKRTVFSKSFSST